MSLQINQEEIDFDPGVIGLLSRLRRLKAEIGEMQEQADILTEQVKSAMGDALIGTVNGAPAVRWTTVESTRFDVKKAREVLPQQVIDLLEVKWPTTQKVEKFTNVEANQFLTIKEGAGIIKAVKHL
jgi:predicted phage-related endonuclease